jgi:plasmid stability protein
VAQLIVRNVDDRLAARLKRRAAANGISMEEEHRRILKEALSPRRSLKSLLGEIPQVGDDGDFERIPQSHREVDL